MLETSASARNINSTIEVMSVHCCHGNLYFILDQILFIIEKLCKHCEGYVTNCMFTLQGHYLYAGIGTVCSVMHVTLWAYRIHV